MANEQMRQTWNESATWWIENEALFDRLYQPVTDAIMQAAEVSAGERVLDVGCGYGTLLAEVVARSARAVGVDTALPMVQAAQLRVPQAVVALGDPQTDAMLKLAPGDPFDAVISRFGVMFFDDPVAAFALLGESAKPEARLAFGCWRTAEENPVFSLGIDTVTAHLADPPALPQPGHPGPTAFAERDYLAEVLTASGWAKHVIEPLDFLIDYAAAAGDGSDGVEERMAQVASSTSVSAAEKELHPRLGDDRWADLLDEVRAELRSHLVDGVMKFPGACWLVSATRT